jgi:hypothetical protein
MQTQLQNARLIARVQRRDLPERRVALRHIRIGEIRMVEEIQHLQPELQAVALGGQAELLQDGQVHARQSGPVAVGASGIAERVRSRNGECAGIEPACQLVGLGPVGGDQRASHYVRPQRR